MKESDELLKDLLFNDDEIRFLNEKFKNLFLESYLELGRQIKKGPQVFTRQKKFEAIFSKKCSKIIDELETKNPGIYKRNFQKRYQVWLWRQDVLNACVKKLRERLREKKVRWFDEKATK